jgi:hypothetical protein
MTFFTSLLGQKAQEIHDGIIKTVVAFDPQGATQAQIDEYSHNVDQLADIAARAETQAQADQKKADELGVSLEQHIHAAEILSAQVDATADAAAKSAKQKGLDKIMADAEQIKHQHDDAVTSAAQSRTYADERKDTHQAAVQKLLTARTRLEAAMRNQQRSHDEATIAAQRAADAKTAAGLTSGLDTMDTALSAMDANAARDHQKAMAANMTAGALSAHADGDAEAAAALAAASGNAPATSISIADRLAALKG